MGVRFAESLVDQVLDGSYAPSRGTDCEASFLVDEYPQTIRLTEFTLFGERARRSFDEPRYLIVQPQVLAGTPRPVQARDIQRFVRPAAARVTSDLPTAALPRPDDAPVDVLREALRSVVSKAPPAGTTFDHQHEAREPNTATAPRLDLPAREFRAAYADWLAQEEAASVRRRLRTFAEFGLAPRLLDPDLSISADDVAGRMADVLFPEAFQPFSAPRAHVALCAAFEQEWRLLGYTRGELVSTLSLAPGERLTLEVHSWDKSSRKSEDELATESEVRTSEKLTQRDALTVAQELAKQRNTSVNANAVVPIPKMPISLSGSTSSQTTESLRRTQESLRERTLEASNSLKLNRKTRIEIARETGQEERQTRVVENTNRCHSLNCHHFEVLSNYLVTTRLVEVRPCVLLDNPRAEFTAEWVLCHEDLLVSSLLDRTFLPGFDAARLLQENETLETIRSQLAAAALEREGEDVAPQVSAIFDAWAELRLARNSVADAVRECGSDIWSTGCILGEVSMLQLERTGSYFSVSARGRTALERLVSDVRDGENAAVTLRRFVSAVSPTDLTNATSPSALQDELFRLGLPQLIVAIILKREPTTRDDAGLRGAVEGAMTYLSTAAPDTELGVGIDPRQLAAAHVAFEQLRCHLHDNWMHYTQALWLREDHGQRFVRLQHYGPVATVIENELLGFYGGKSAYPLRTDVVVQREVDLDRLVAAAERVIEGRPPRPALVTLPTPGTVLEAVTGECDGCEDYIRESRLIDLRRQAAMADQAEAEAARLQERVDQDQLSDPIRHPAHLVVELRQPPPPPP